MIIISRASDKIFKIIEQILHSQTSKVTIIVLSNNLEKKSKLRNLFEKNDKTISIAVYEDNFQTLNLIVSQFLKDKKMSLSQENINLIVERSNGDRINLQNELKKIENFLLIKKNISTEEVIKLTNLAENFDYTHLVNSSLARNKKKTINILNENNFANEECITIIRIYLNKLKRLLKIFSEIEITKNVDKVLHSFKPAIFWKEKDFVKQQIKILNNQKIQKLMSKANDVELLIKKNPSLSINLLTDFILEQLNDINN